MKFIVIKTPKVEYTCEIKIKQAGRYGRYYLYVNNEMFAQGTQKYCQKVCNELLSGHRKLNKSFLNEIERRAEKNRKNSLPVLEGGFERKE